MQDEDSLSCLPGPAVIGLIIGDQEDQGPVGTKQGKNWKEAACPLHRTLDSNRKLWSLQRMLLILLTLQWTPICFCCYKMTKRCLEVVMSFKKKINLGS